MALQIEMKNINQTGIDLPTCYVQILTIVLDKRNQNAIIHVAYWRDAAARAIISALPILVKNFTCDINNYPIYFSIEKLSQLNYEPFRGGYLFLRAQTEFAGGLNV